MLDSVIRRFGFWMVDFVKGGNIRKAYKDIKKIMNLPYEDMRKIQVRYEMNLINHAKETTAYYANTLAGISKLEDCPVIDKNILKENYEAFQSYKYKNEKKHYMSTSGSTGTPFTIIQDMRKRSRVLAELIYFNEKVNNNIGDKFIFFRVWTVNNRESKLKFWMKNEIPIDILHFTDENFEKIRKVLKTKKNVKVLLGYVSTFEYLANYLEKQGDTRTDFNIKTIITGSEIQTQETRRRLEELFGCNVVSRYANEENGVIAHQCISSEEFHVNSANYRVEILKLDSNEAADYGELGRVVVTDLFNYAFPLIRYDTGDLAIKNKKSECGWGSEIISNVQGRRVDLIYDTKGNALSPHTWSVYMWNFNKLKQYQFIQEEEKKYVLKVNGAEKYYSDSTLINYLKEILGNDAQIIIEHVNDIPHLNSGKFKKTVCNWHPDN